MKLFVENKEGNLYNLGMGQTFLKFAQSPVAIKEKIDEFLST